jgi:hypothetical protein
VFGKAVYRTSFYMHPVLNAESLALASIYFVADGGGLRSYVDKKASRDRDTFSKALR